MFLPTTHREIKSLGWKLPDIILVSGDTYIDSSYIGVAVIGRVLLHAGYSVAIIAQPDIHSSKDICRLGEPGLFWGVTGGGTYHVFVYTDNSQPNDLSFIGHLHNP